MPAADPGNTAALEAGSEALRRGAWGEARAVFARVVAAAPSAEACEGLGWALYWLGETAELLDERERAYRAYLEGGDPAAAARVAIGLAVGSFDLRGAAVASGWIERARRLLGGVPTAAVHGWLAFYEGHMARLVDGDAARARRLARRAERLATQHGEAQLELLARALEGLALVNLGRVEEGMRRVDEATAAALAGEMRDLESVAQTCCILLYACERVRDYKRAAEWQQRISRFSCGWEIEPLFLVCSTQRAAMLAGCGRWRDAEVELEATLAKLEQSRPLLVPDALVHLAELRRRQGRHDEALALLRRVEGRSEALLTHAAIARERGDAVAALELAQRLLDRPLGEKWVERAAALEIVVVAAATTGDRARAASALASLTSLNRRVRTPMVHGLERLAAGELASAEGEHETARQALAAGVDAFRAAQAPFEEAGARVALARTLLALGRPTAAVPELEGAVASFERLGAERDRQGAMAMLAGARAPRAAAGGQPLTPREREVLHLVASGLGDKQLAARLALSEHTVHRHVANILRKLDATSRSAAVAMAVRRGWLE